MSLHNKQQFYDLTKLHFVIATFNGGKYLTRCLQQIQDQTPHSPIHIIDNASNDNTIAIAENYNTQILKNGKNIGFGSANNIGIENALNQGAENIFLLNQDAYLEKNAIQTFTNKQISTQPAIHSFLQLNGNGTALDNNWSTNYLSEANCPELIQRLVLPNPDNTLRAKFTNAAAWVLPKELLLNIGGFNPSFYHYGEDNNLTHRAHHFGFPTLIHLDCRVLHDRENRHNTKFHYESTVKQRGFLQTISHPNNDESAAAMVSRVKTIYRKKRLRGYKKSHIIESLYLDFIKHNNIDAIYKNRDTSKSRGPSFLNLIQR